MKTSSPTILFMGTPTFAATALSGLVDAGFDVVGVVTRPDTNKGRSGVKSPSAVKIEADKHEIPVLQPEDKAELTEMVREINPELIVVAAFGMIIPQAVLDIPKYGALNIHGSLLPKYRGASPIAEAILSEDKKTGITIMKMNAGMDEGPIISQYTLPVFSPVIPSVAEESLSNIPEGSREQEPALSESRMGRDDKEEGDTTASLSIKMAELGAKAIIETIPSWVSGELKAIPQDKTKATYCKRLTKEDGHIDWGQPAERIERMVRAYQPWPTAYTFAGESRIKILKAGWVPGLRPGMTELAGVLHFEDGHIFVCTGEGTLEILELQPEGKKPMSAKDFINGNQQIDGTRLS